MICASLMRDLLCFTPFKSPSASLLWFSDCPFWKRVVQTVHHAWSFYSCHSGTLPYHYVRIYPDSQRSILTRAAMALSLEPNSSRQVPFLSCCCLSWPSKSFVGGIVAFKALPRPQFASLQQKIFPIYFGLQTALPAVLALTYPGVKTTLGTSASGLSGSFAEQNRWSVLIPIFTIFATSLVNMVAVGPATTKIMRERKHQGELSYQSAVVGCW